MTDRARKALEAWGATLTARDDAEHAPLLQALDVAPDPLTKDEMVWVADQISDAILVRVGQGVGPVGEA